MRSVILNFYKNRYCSKKRETLLIDTIDLQRQQIDAMQSTIDKVWLYCYFYIYFFFFLNKLCSFHTVIKTVK